MEGRGRGYFVGTKFGLSPFENINAIFISQLNRKFDISTMPRSSHVEIDNDYSSMPSTVITRRVRVVERSQNAVSIRELHELLLLLELPDRISSQRFAGTPFAVIEKGRLACSRIPSATHNQFGRRQKLFGYP